MELEFKRKWKMKNRSIQKMKKDQFSDKKIKENNVIEKSC
jgi:hypothetical protein